MKSTSGSVEWCVDQAKGRVPVIAGAGSNSTAEAIELSQHAEKAGADAVLIVTPYYNKPTQEGLYQHYKAINDAIGIPIIIYNIPARSVIDMSVDTMKRLFELKNIAGVKDATANVVRVSQQRAAMGEDFNQLSGEDATALGFMAHGGHGCISVTSNVAPRLCSEFQSACLRGDYRTALELQDKLMPLHTRAVHRDQSGAGEIRAVAARPCADTVRLPMVTLADKTKAAVREAMVHAGPDQLRLTERPVRARSQWRRAGRGGCHARRIQEIRAARQCRRSRGRRDHRRGLRRDRQLAGRRHHHADDRRHHRRRRLLQLLRAALVQRDGRTLAEAKKQGAVLAWGNFLTIVINFVIIAFVLFMVIKAITRLKQQERRPRPRRSRRRRSELLTEIRDVLKSQSK